MTSIANKILRRVLAAALCAALLPVAQAASFGAITVQSGLGQPLSAEIELITVTLDEFDEIKAGIASRQAYEDAGLNYLEAFRQVRINTDRRPDGRSILRLSGNAAINEPAIELLVEMVWPTGRVMQKYSVLLDLAK